MLEDGLSYPARGDWIGRIAIGGLLLIFSVLLLPLFLVMGYLINVLKTTVNGDSEPPAFEAWGDLFVKGIVGTVISFVYSIVPFLIFGGIAVVFTGLGGLVGGDGGGILAGIGFLTFLLAIPVVFLVYYMVPAALTNYAIEGKLGAAFEFGTLKPVLLSGEYLVAVLAPLVVAVLLWIVTGILSITIIGVVLVPFLQFYGQVAVFRMFGSAFKSVSTKSTAAI